MDNFVGRDDTIEKSSSVGSSGKDKETTLPDSAYSTDISRSNQEKVEDKRVKPQMGVMQPVGQGLVLSLVYAFKYILHCFQLVSALTFQLYDLLVHSMLRMPSVTRHYVARDSLKVEVASLVEECCKDLKGVCIPVQADLIKSYSREEDVEAKVLAAALTAVIYLACLTRCDTLPTTVLETGVSEPTMDNSRKVESPLACICEAKPDIRFEFDAVFDWIRSRSLACVGTSHGSHSVHIAERFDLPPQSRRGMLEYGGN